MTTHYVSWDTEPALDHPIVVAAFEGWNDAGDAASWAVRHLHQHWGAQPFASVEPEEFFDFSETRPTIELDDDERQLHWPSNRFSATNNPRSAILISGVEPHLRWRTFTDEVLAVANKYSASMIVTLGALLAEVPHSRPVTIFGNSQDKELAARLHLQRSNYEGPTGIVGVLTSRAQAAGIPTVSLWAAVPSYVSGAASPKAALALVERLKDVISVPIPVTDLQIAASAYERQIGDLVSEDEDTAEYIKGLEDQYDEGAMVAPDPSALVAEVEEFLRDQPEK